MAIRASWDVAQDNENKNKRERVETVKQSYNYLVNLAVLAGQLIIILKIVKKINSNGVECQKIKTEAR